ncbi:MAG: hypothetical protein HY077_11105 [Elusimicrobia bacterium]|nr:hypothetical protein [Elusimicrobiota bacterium]
MKASALAAVLACFLVSGCIEHLPATLPPSQLGVTDSVPVGPAEGLARSFHFFGWRRFGDDTTESAIRAAKKGNQDLDLINVLVDRRVHCLPACEAAFFTWSETEVRGTLVRYKRLPDWEKPQSPDLTKFAPGRGPPAEPLLERLMHLYAQDPKSAAEFYQSLDHDTRRQLVELVVSEKGLTTGQGWTFRIPKSASPEEKRFLAWFVGTYTTYQPLDE